MTKHKACFMCGCERSILVKNPVVFYQDEKMELTYHTMCVPCLLRSMHLGVDPASISDAYKTVEYEDGPAQKESQ